MNTKALAALGRLGAGALALRKSLHETTVLLRDLIGDTPRALQRLVAGEVPHSYPVTVEEAQALGLEVAAPDDRIRALIQALAPKGRIIWPLVQQ